MMNDFLTLGPDGRVVDHEGKTLDYKRDLSGSEGVPHTVVAVEYVVLSQNIGQN